MKKLITVAAISFCLLTAQGFNAEAKKPSQKKAPAHQEQSQVPSALTGKVIETMDSSGYTYAHIENKGEKLWVAVPQTQIKKGETVSFRPGMVMENFESKTLKKKFDKIVFSDGVQGPQAGGQAATSGGSKDKAPKTKEKITVKKAAGANAYTIAELFKNSKKLDNKTVVVKGKVIKVSSGIMKRNWVHIQDGTGDARKGNFDLVVTSTGGALPAKDDVVTVTGTLAKDRDFGAGYKYSVIVENATFTK